MNRKAIIAGIVVVVALTAALLLMRSRKSSSGEQEEKHDPNVVEISADAQRNGGIEFATTVERKVQQVVTTTGVISPDEARVSHIVPLSQGVVEDVFVQLGDRVQKGQPLLVYDSIELGESVGEYKNLLGGLDKAEAQQEVAKRSVERANSLIAVEAISPRELELRRAEYQQATAEVESRRAEVARAEEKLHRFGMSDPDIKRLNSSEHAVHRTASHNTVRAPLAGVVTTYDVSKGEVVGRDKELFTVVDTSTVWALADVYEKDIQYVARGGQCDVTLASYPGEVFTGKIAYLSDALDPASRTAKLRCVLTNPAGRLKLEMFATVTVPTKESRTGVSVPASAVQEISGQPVVFVQTEPTKFEKRTIEIGERTPELVEVKSGVKSGDKVVTKGSFYVKSALMRELIGGEE
ncbi:MAG TPA: efflux RND transporter periplasmic adaptor subunit [Terriglobales bacterium]|nr:efflux RND transporter periplasmic adaptor subunit [Terriglobales bacterium]